MRRKLTLTNKLLALGVGFLLVALTSIGFTLWVTWQLEGGAAAVNEAGRLRMNMLRMELARQGGAEAELAQVRQRFADSLELLRVGDPSRPLFVPWDADIRERFEAIRSGWEALEPGQSDVDRGGNVAAQVSAFVGEIDEFVRAIELRLMRWTAILYVFQMFLVALAIGAAVAFIAVSYLLVLDPVTRLGKALAAMRRGEFGTRLEVSSNDEFGQLAAGFNQMAQALQASHHELERKVREKTTSIAEQNQRLGALYAVSALAAEASSLETLTQDFVQLVRRVLGCDGALVRWSDEANARYVLLAADGLSPAFVEHEQCLNAGACACGPLRARARLCVIPIEAGAGPALPHCGQAGFQTVVSVPVSLQQRVLGELTLFYRQPTALGDETRELLASMARHLASAMEGLRAGALERETAVAEERRLLARELHDSIAQSLAFLKIQTQLLRDALASGNDAARDASLAELDAGVRESLADVRELLVHFRTRTQEEDIERALRATLSKFEHQTGLTTALAMSGHGVPLAPDVQIQLLHIVQEALSNVRKHAGARHVEIRVQRHPHWRFEVRDDGRGFDPAAVPPDSLHVGLGIMRERAERIGAELQLRSTPGAGTCVVVTLPAAGAARAPAQDAPAQVSVA